MAWMLPGDDDQPATRRDLSSAREAMEHKVRADIAEVRTEIAEVCTEIAGVRTEMAGLSVEVANRSNKQTTFLAGLLIMSYGTLLVAVLRIS